MSSYRWLLSLRARVLALAMLAALPGFVIATLDAVTSLRQTEQAARASLSSALGHARRDYTDVSGDAATDLAVAASTLSGFETGCPDALHALAQQHPEYQDVGLVREDGQVICALSGVGRAAQPIDQELLRRALELPGHAAQQRACRPAARSPHGPATRAHAAAARGRSAAPAAPGRTARR